MTALLLKLQEVSLSRGGRLLFEGLSVELGAGDALQVVGPNGSGKSSLLRFVAGLLPGQRGAMIRTPHIALADDHVALDRELPLERALAFWSPAAGAMEKLGIAHLAVVPVRLLSSGQLKRATLARVVASGAPLWLLDEPLNALDTDGAARLSHAVDTHLAAGGAVLAASHQPLPGDWPRLELGA